MRKPIIIAISGSTGSGKSYLAQALCHEFGAAAALICVDSYYKDQQEKSFAERVTVNYDEPNSTEFELLLSHLQLLLRGESVSIPVYDYTQHTRSAKVEIIDPSSIVIIEGIFALYWNEIATLCDVKIFVDTPLDICLARRLERDVKTRGRVAESVMTQWNSTVLPSYMQYCLPTKERADVVVRGMDSTETIIRDLKTRLRLN